MNLYIQTECRGSSFECLCSQKLSENNSDPLHGNPFESVKIQFILFASFIPTHSRFRDSCVCEQCSALMYVMGRIIVLRIGQYVHPFGIDASDSARPNGGNCFDSTVVAFAYEMGPL